MERMRSERDDPLGILFGGGGGVITGKGKTHISRTNGIIKPTLSDRPRNIGLQRPTASSSSRSIEKKGSEVNRDKVGKKGVEGSMRAALPFPLQPGIKSDSAEEEEDEDLQGVVDGKKRRRIDDKGKKKEVVIVKETGRIAEEKKKKKHDMQNGIGRKQERFSMERPIWNGTSSSSQSIGSHAQTKIPDSKEGMKKVKGKVKEKYLNDEMDPDEVKNKKVKTNGIERGSATGERFPLSQPSRSSTSSSSQSVKIISQPPPADNENNGKKKDFGNGSTIHNSNSSNRPKKYTPAPSTANAHLSQKGNIKGPSSLDGTTGTTTKGIRDDHISRIPVLTEAVLNTAKTESSHPKPELYKAGIASKSRDVGYEPSTKSKTAMRQGKRIISPSPDPGRPETSATSADSPDGKSELIFKLSSPTTRPRSTSADVWAETYDAEITPKPLVGGHAFFAGLNRMSFGESSENTGRKISGLMLTPDEEGDGQDEGDLDVLKKTEEQLAEEAYLGEISHP